MLVTVTAFHEMYQKEGGSGTSPYILDDERKDGFRVRLILMEHFTGHRVSMGMHDYSYVTFKEVEQQILQSEVATDAVNLMINN